MSDRSDKSESLLPGVTTRQSESDAKRLIRSDQRLLSGRDRNSFARFCSDYSLSEEAVIDFGIIVAAWSLAGLNSASVRTALTKLSSAPAKEARVHVIRSDQSCLEAIRRFVGGGELAISGATRLVIDSIDARSDRFELKRFFDKDHGQGREPAGESDLVRVVCADNTVSIYSLGPTVGSHLPDIVFTILKQLISRPEITVGELELVERVERDRIINSAWNSSTTVERELTVFAAFENAANQFLELPAISWRDQTLTYKEFLSQVVRYSDRLAQRGIRKGSVVGVSFERSFELMVAIFALMRLEAIYLPIDPHLPIARKRFMLRDSGAQILLAPKQYAVSLDDEERDLTRSSSIAPDTAYVIYTSGSTGKPKGVMIDHAGILNRIRWAQAQHPLEPNDTLLQKTNIMFDVAVWELFGWFLGGARLHLLEQGAEADPKALIQSILNSNTTIVHFVPSMLTAFLEKLSQRSDCKTLPLKRIHVSGEVLPPKQVSGVFRLLGEGRDIELINLYGPTEASVDATFHDCQPEDAAKASVPIGKPINDTGIYILDARGKVLPTGVSGELYIAGRGVGRGYVNLDELSAARFRKDPYRSGERMYATGDRARWSVDGTLEYLGRFDHQVKLRGFRIELPEIEALLARYEAVSGAAVAIMKDASGDDRLVAYVVPKKDAQIDLVLLRQYILEHLPSYMMPERFVELEELPLGRTGKVDRSSFSNPFQSRRDVTGFVRSNTNTPLIDGVLRVWREILEIDNLTPDLPFFDAGGNSMKALRVISKFEQMHDIELPVTSVFQFPTPKQYAAFLERAVSGSIDHESFVGGPTKLDQRSSACRDVAVVGMSGRLPGASSLEEFWSNSRRGIESVRALSDEELLAFGATPNEISSPKYIKSKGVLDNADCFDAAFFGYSPREAERMDPQIRVLHEVVWSAMEDAGSIQNVDECRTGLFASASPNYNWLEQVMPDAQSMVEKYQLWLLNEKDFLTTRIAHKLNFRGPCVTIQTACSSSLAALHYARKSLIDGDCDIAVAAGVCITYPLIGGYVAEDGMILSQDGHCRAFDERASGTIGGNGSVAVVLKPLVTALADGDMIHAVIKGSSINNDGAEKAGFSAPSVHGQARAISDAIRDAGVQSESVRYLEAHGTGTPIGDPIEIEALKLAFGPSPSAHCALGSVKANIGHLDAAAGLAGFVKAVDVVKRKQVPPMANFSQENKALKLNGSPFYVADCLTEPVIVSEPFRAGVSSFGMGGTNVHVVLESAPVETSRTGTEDNWTILPCSAKTPEALKVTKQKLLKRLEREASASLSDVAWTLQTGRRHFRYRDYVVANTMSGAIQALELDQSSTVNRLRKPVAPKSTFKIAYLYTGQGAHYHGMGQQLYEHNEIFRENIHRCAATLSELCEFDLIPYFDGQADCDTIWVNKTELVQPVLFSFQFALSKVLQNWGVSPHVAVGHSLGEIAAACEAGVFSLSDALRFVHARGRLMGEGGDGRMVSVMLPASDLVDSLPKSLDVAAINDRRSTVVAGAPNDIQAFVEQLEVDGVHCRELQSKFAFHSRHVDPLLNELKRVVATLNLSAPEFDLISTVTGDVLTPQEAKDPTYWVEQARQPVNFADAVDTLMKSNVDVLLEVGPGESLKNLVLRDRADIAALLVENTLPGEGNKIPSEPAYLNEKIGELWKFGFPIDWAVFSDAEKKKKVSLPTYPFERKRYWPTLLGQRDIRKPDRVQDIDNWFYSVSWHSRAVVTKPEIGLSNLLVLADKDGKDLPLIKSLSDLGQTVRVVFPGRKFVKRDDGNFEVDPTRAEDFDQVLQTLSDEAQFPTAILHLWCLDSIDVAVDIASEESLDKGYRALLQIGTALGRHTWSEELNILIAANQIENIMGDETVCPGKSAMFGFSKIFPLETASVRCRIVDCGALAKTPERLAAAILDEVSDDSDEQIVVYRGRHRWLKRYEPVSPSRDNSDAISIRGGGVYLITGGLGGIGLALATSIAEQANVTIVLAGRRDFPERKDWQAMLGDSKLSMRTRQNIEKIQSIEAVGSKVVVIQCDVASAHETEMLVSKIKSDVGDINGVIHAAGLADYEGMIQRREWNGTQDVLAPKIRGALNLKNSIAEKHLDFVVLCSSIGNIVHEMKIGQSGYNAANEFLDACAHAFNSDVVTWKSLNWTDWKGTGMTQDAVDYWSGQASTNQTLLNEVLKDAIDEAEGGKAFLKALQLGDPQIIISESNLPERCDYVRSLLAGDRWGSTLETTESGSASSISFETVSAVVEWLSDRWIGQFGFETVDVNANFFDAGANSLDLVQLHSRCCSELGIELPLVSLYDYPTLSKLGEHIFSTLRLDSVGAEHLESSIRKRQRKRSKERVKSLTKKLKR